MNLEKKILVADASSYDRSIMCNALKNTYTILQSNTGIKTLEIFLKEIDNIKLAILDISLPHLDGFEILYQIKEINKAKKIPIVLISNKAIKQNILKAFSYGASDFILKPFEDEFFRQRILSLLGNSSKAPGKALHKLVINSDNNIEFIKEYDKFLNKTFKNLFSFRQIETPYHLKRVSLFTGIILKSLSKNVASGVDFNDSQIEEIIRASTYHDVGKLAIPDEILRNRDDLTTQQQIIYNSHTTKGAELLSINNNPELESFIQLSINISNNHHESWDGSGFPHGIKGNEIPLSAQVVGAATDLDKFSRDFLGIVDNIFEITMEQIFINQNKYNPLILRALSQSELVIDKIIKKYPDRKI